MDRRIRLLVPLAAAVALTCAREPIGTFLVDAGSMMRGDAMAQQQSGGSKIEFLCDQQRSWRVLAGNRLSVTTTYFADLNLDDLVLQDSVYTITMCGYESFSPPTADCPPGAACTGEKVPALPCSQGFASVDLGRAIVGCGFRVETTVDGVQESVTGGRHARGYMVVK